MTLNPRQPPSGRIVWWYCFVKNLVFRCFKLCQSCCKDAAAVVAVDAAAATAVLGVVAFLVVTVVVVCTAA